MAIPYGKLAFSKANIFQQLTTTFDMQFAEQSFKMFIPVLDILNHFTPFQLMVTYLSILLHTIQPVRIQKFPEEFKTLMDTCKNKIDDLCKRLGLHEHCLKIIQLARFYQSVAKATENGYDFFRPFVMQNK